LLKLLWNQWNKAMDENIKKLMYKATHRGTKELDLILGRFLTLCGLQMPQNSQENFARFLDEQDPDIYDWILGYKVPPENYAHLVEEIKNCRSD
jgi:antitoxin CptB